MNVEKPIFIVGAGRSGSTVFHEIFCEHPDVTWFSSRGAERDPQGIARRRRQMQLIDLPLVGRFFRRRFWAGEVYEFWDTLFPGFSMPYRDLVRDDVSLRTAKKVREGIGAVLSPRRPRALIKITGWNRMRFLDEIFPDARFIHVRRDPRGVINSVINVHFWLGWRGPENWRFGNLTPEQNELWAHFDHSFYALAGIGVERMARAVLEAREEIDPARFVEIDYEALCEDPVGIFREAIEFSELRWTPGFERTVDGWGLRNTNVKWQRDLTERQQEIVDFFGRRIDHIEGRASEAPRLETGARPTP